MFRFSNPATENYIYFLVLYAFSKRVVNKEVSKMVKERSKVSSRTSVVLDKELRTKLVMLSQALSADMGDIIRKAIEVFYEYTRKYAEEKGKYNILRILDLAEDESLWRPEAEIDEIGEYALSKIKKEGVTLPAEKTGLE